MSEEKLQRTSRDRAAPRVVDSSVLEKFGIFVPNLMLFHSLIRSGELTEKFTTLRERFSLSDNNGRPTMNKFGDILLVIETVEEKSESYINLKRTRQPRDLPQKWQNRFRIISSALLTNFATDVFPLHMHFVLKNSPLYPLPFEYIEIYMKAEYGNQGNILADYEEGDRAEASQIILPKGTNSILS